MRSALHPQAMEPLTSRGLFSSWALCFHFVDLRQHHTTLAYQPSRFWIVPYRNPCNYTESRGEKNHGSWVYCPVSLGQRCLGTFRWNGLTFAFQPTEESE